MPASRAPPPPSPDRPPLRVALVITELDVGGAERCLANLALGLNRERFEPAVIALGPPPADDELVRRLQDAGVPVDCLGLTSPWQAARGLWRLRRTLLNFRPDIVQTFLYHANVLGTAAARLAGVKVVVGGARVADPRPRRLWLERQAARGMRRLACVSRGVAEAYAATGVPREKLVVIGNGVSPAAWAERSPPSAESLGLPAGRRWLVFVGRLDWQKGLDRLLERLPHVFRQLPEHDLAVVGDGPERRAVEEVAERLGIAERVHFAGWRCDVADWLALAEIVVLPSRWEGMSNVLLEALAAGKPVIATRVPGTEDLLGCCDDQQTRSADDLTGFVDRLLAFANHDRLRQIVGDDNREQVQREHSLTAMVGKYERLYEELAGRGSGSAADVAKNVRRTTYR